MKLAIGLVATMSAIGAGIAVSSAKGAYDTERSEVILDGIQDHVPWPSAGCLRTRRCCRAALLRNPRGGNSTNVARSNAAGRQIAIPTFKQVILPTPRCSSFHHRTTCRESQIPGNNAGRGCSSDSIIAGSPFGPLCLAGRWLTIPVFMASGNFCRF